MVGFFACRLRILALEWQAPQRRMSKETTEERLSPGRALRAGLQTLLLVLVVPLGIMGGWRAVSPTSQKLAEQAAGGADAAALLELVQRAPHQQQAADILHHLLGQDAAALETLAGLASAHELALHHLIYVARSQPEAIKNLSRVPMSYPFALALLRHIKPEGIARLQQLTADANACFMLGVAHENGCHMPINQEQAAYWYGKAREQNPELAEYHYARLAYLCGLSCHTNDARRTFYWFREAALCHHAAAQCALGVCYAAGEGVEPNLSEAVAWYHRSAEQDYLDALFNLGWCYLHGEGVAPDATQAVMWFHRAANRGDGLSQYYLGRAYELGLGLPVDYTQALTWYRRAAGEQANDAAQCALGHCYAQGRGVEQNWKKAAYWYQLAAVQGHQEAQLALAQCYEKGLGLTRNPDLARQWHDRATNNSPTTKSES